MLDRPALLELLEALAAELDSIGVRGEMFIVGYFLEEVVGRDEPD